MKMEAVWFSKIVGILPHLYMAPQSRRPQLEPKNLRLSVAVRVQENTT